MFVICPVLSFRVCRVQAGARKGGGGGGGGGEEEGESGLSPPVFACSGILETLVQGLHVQDLHVKGLHESL